MQNMRGEQMFRFSWVPQSPSNLVSGTGTKSILLRGQKVAKNRETNFLNTVLIAVARSQSCYIFDFPKFKIVENLVLELHIESRSDLQTHRYEPGPKVYS